MTTRASMSTTSAWHSVETAPAPDGYIDNYPGFYGSDPVTWIRYAHDEGPAICLIRGVLDIEQQRWIAQEWCPLPGDGPVYPEELTPALDEVLGLMNFTTCPIAHAFRAAGEPIPTKTEREQAFVLHWLIKLALRHGDGWRKIAGDRLQELANAAKEAEPNA
jgi:hypothetical protein